MVSWKWLVGALVALVLTLSGHVYSSLKDADATALVKIQAAEEHIVMLQNQFGRIEERLIQAEKSTVRLEYKVDKLGESINALTLLPSFKK